MSGAFYGYTPVDRMCRDCGKKYVANTYDPASIRCPECRGKRYREEALNMVTNE